MVQVRGEWLSQCSAAFSKASARERSPTKQYISDVIFYCSVAERLRALALLNAALHWDSHSPRTWTILNWRRFRTISERSNVIPRIFLNKQNRVHFSPSICRGYGDAERPWWIREKNVLISRAVNINVLEREIMKGPQPLVLFYVLSMRNIFEMQVM